jgi:hypothetical protein
MNGVVVNSGSGCTVTSGGITGSWSSSATYPSQADIPPAICVNLYDLHFAGGTSPNAADFDPAGNNDNSIKTNSFDPTVGQGFCSTPHIAVGGPTTTTTKASASTVTAGSPVTDAVTVTGSSALGQPAGTVAFYVCGPTTANALCTSTANAVGTATLPHSGDTGFVSTGTSSAFTPTTAGTYCFAAVFTPASSSLYGASSDNTTGTVDAAECFTASVAAAANNTTATTPTTPTTPAPVKGATVVFTGEPWAGSKGIELAVAGFGLGLLTLGLLRRRSLRRGANAQTR